MATTRHMIRKLEQAGYEVETCEGYERGDGSRTSDKFYARLDGWRIEFWDSSGQGSAPYVIREGAEDDLMTDYFAGSFADNITQAINRAASLRDGFVRRAAVS